MRGEDPRREPAAEVPDRALWQRSRMTEAAEDDAERALDLAGFADGRLDLDDRERVAERLAGDPLALGDIAAARALGGRAEEAAPEPVIARACALIPSGPQRGLVLPFRVGGRARPRLRSVVGYASLAAAMAVACWLGFTLGMDASLSVAQFGSGGEDGFLRELLDPSTGFISDPTEGAQT